MAPVELFTSGAHYVAAGLAVVEIGHHRRHGRSFTVRLVRLIVRRPARPVGRHRATTR